MHYIHHKLRQYFFISCLLCITGELHAARSINALDFSLIKKGSADDGPVILVIGGIQGDEPGGFNAASLLTTHYQVQRGQLWVVPNLNFPSIIKRSRGIHGDMNRKFSQITRQDPEFESVEMTVPLEVLGCVFERFVERVPGVRQVV